LEGFLRITRIITPGARGVFLSILVCLGSAYALEPRQVAVLVNEQVAKSIELGRYYCGKRGIPAQNILYLKLGGRVRDDISRADYERLIAGPVREELSKKRVPGQIRCLVTTYGIPLRVGPRGRLRGREQQLEKLEESLKQEQKKLERLEKDGGGASADELKTLKKKVAVLRSLIEAINGRQTGASVDSELAMVLVGEYELYRWQPNMLRGDLLELDFQTLMVSRLDGPDYGVVKALVDKAIKAEQTGLKGTAYIDSRGLKVERGNPYSRYDQSLRDLAVITRLRTNLPALEEASSRLFGPGSCPQTAIYCGWYSLGKYVDAFDFVDGAVGYHIASFEAVDLHDPNSSHWCPAMLMDGITATLGPVAEPYLHAFPEPAEFFGRLYAGDCLAEAYCRTKPFNSWQMVLIGDPLYRPFAKD